MIPKTVHITWKTKDILNSDSPLIINGIRKFIELNPEWKVTVYDDNEVDEYLKQNLEKDDYYRLKNKHIVEKSDVWRLLKIYLEGGMYVDIDRLCNKPMPDIQDHIKWVLPICNEYDFSQDIMISEAGNPAFSETLKLNLSRRREGHTNIYSLGPETYMHGITYCLFGKMISQDPGKDHFNEMIENIKKIPFIMVIRERPPKSTLLHDGIEANHEQWKKEFYKQSRIRHWTNEW